jgi:amino acid adenylation domain-containing protein
MVWADRGEGNADDGAGPDQSSGHAGCHAVSFRLHGRSASEMERRIRSEWSRSPWRLPDADLWVTSSTAEPDSEASTTRLARERELGIAAPARCRIVLIGYAAPVIDVVISADRRSLGRARLLLLAEAIRQDLPVSDLPMPEHLRTHAEPAGKERLAVASGTAQQAPADWGLGGLPTSEGRGRATGLHLRQADVRAHLVPAIALTLARFRGGGGATVASLLDLALPEGPAERLALFNLPDDQDRTAAEFAQSCLDEDRFAGWQSTPADREARSAAGSVDARLWFDLMNPGAAVADGIDYYQRAVLLHPFNIGLERSGADGLRLSYEFDRSSYHETMVETFDGCVSFVMKQLAEATAGSARAADSIRLVEVEALVEAGGEAETASSGEGIIEALRRFVADQPDSPAITFQDETLTYAEFDCLSSRMAASMKALGVRRNDRVGVCLERSLELVPVLAAILKCGATYVPIDPAAPQARRDFIIRDSDISLLITSGGDSPADSKVETAHPSALGQAGSAASEGAFAGGNGPAYIIYTSGSTGRPKGVLIAQQSVLALVDALAADLTLSPADRWTLFHSTAFDFATWEIWGCLLSGGHLFVVPFFVSRSPDQFLQLLADRRITVLNQTPTAFSQLQAADQEGRHDLCSRLVIFGGETLDPRLLLPWMDRYPGSACRIVNMYGITETTVHVTAEPVTRQHALARSRTVGAPIRGWSVQIKDSKGRDLPRGLTGEIYVGGSGLALGYWNNPEEDAARFVIDDASGRRLYRSGDRGRLRPDGRLDHLGRMDNQVKLRGFRIELDEIRSVILDLPGVAHAMVILREQEQEASLEAFVIATGRTGAEIRADLFRILPDYMIPARVSVLDHFPLTVNGKFDVEAALSAADRQAADEPAQPHGQGQLAPADSDELAETIATQWSGVFGQAVTPADNFFDLGGNSLIAVKLAALMRKLNCPVGSVRDIYVHQTPDQLAQAWRDQIPA